MFKELSELMNKGIESLNITIAKREDRLVVSVLPKTDAIKDSFKDTIPPVVIKATPEELDKAFIKALTEPLGNVNKSFSNIREWEKQMEDAKAKSDMEKKKKEERDKEHKSLVEKAEKAVKEEKWEKALEHAVKAINIKSSKDAEKIKEQAEKKINNQQPKLI